MALTLADRVQQTGTANTTVSFTLSGLVTGFQSFAVIGNGNTTYYAATDDTGNWEVGIGTYSTTGPTLTRTTILASSNAGAAVTFSGTINAFVTYPSERSVNLDANSVAVINTINLSGGTANGVTYLNASNVLTSGTALTFNGATLASSTSESFRTKNDNGFISFYNTANTTRTGYIQFNAVTPASFVNEVSQPFAWSTGGSEAMRLTSTGLGIGTTSPQAKLQVLDLLKISNAAQSQGALALGDGSTTVFGVGLARWNGATNAAGAGGMGYFSQGPSNSGGHYFYTGDAVAGSTTLRATIDTAGNLGLGVTPSAWDSNSKNIQLTAGSIYSFGTAEFASVFNAFYGQGAASFTYVNNGFASRYAQTSGQHKWYTAPSGTAGAAITFTQAMTLNASGQLGIGVTSPVVKLDVGGTDAMKTPVGTTGQRPTGATGYLRFNTDTIQFEGYNGTAWSSVGGGASGGAGNPIMYENDSVVSVNYTMTTGKNASSTGPLTINAGIAVTVPSGSTWVIL